MLTTQPNPNNLRVLIACECSGTVREAFAELGFNAWSCDVKESEMVTNRHMVADVRDVLGKPEIYGSFDLIMVLHPPCTRLCASGVRWLSEPPTNAPSSCEGAEAEIWPTLNRADRLAMMWEHLDRGAKLFQDCLDASAPFVAVENPVMHKYAKERINFENTSKPFYVQPWQFADHDESEDNEKKRTGFWCRGLPPLEATGPLDGSTARDSCHKASPGVNRGADRSRFHTGMADAMALQWGMFALDNLNTAQGFAA